MKTWLLIIIISTAEMEQHTVVTLPDQKTCETARDSYLAATLIYKGARDERINLIIDEVRCEAGI